MNRLKIITVFVFIMTYNYSQAMAATWYVDNQANGANNGTSWADAWQHFADISWASISPGDDIQISGGTTSKTYRSEQLDINANGTHDNRIVIHPGQTFPHNGKVIVDMDNSTNSRITSNKFITLSGRVGEGTECKMRFTKGSDYCIAISGASSAITLEYLEIDNVYYSGNDHDRLIAIGGISTPYSILASEGPFEISNCILHDTTDAIHAGAPGNSYASSYGEALIVHDCDIYNIRDDGFTLLMGSVDIYNNIIRDRILPVEGHPDGIQMWGRYYRIYNNYFHGWQDIEGGNAIIYIEPDGGNNMDLCNNQPRGWKIYNNLFYEDKSNNNMDFFQIGFSDPDWESLSDLYIVNNTMTGPVDNAIVVGWSGTHLDKEDVVDLYIMNNIFLDASRNTAGVALTYPANDGGTNADFGSLGDGASITVDYNCFWGDGSSNVVWGSYTNPSEYTYANFKIASGCQDNEVRANPSLNSEWKPDSKNDPIVDAGTNVVRKGGSLAVFVSNEDKSGVPRPQGLTWEIGAYEYDEGSTLSTPVSEPDELKILK